MRSKKLPLEKISLWGETQPRAAIDDLLVLEYSRDMEAGVEFPPVVVFFDGAAYWLVDGFHRFFAARKAGLEKLACEVHQGTREEARWHSYGANKAHGLRRTNADKLKAVIAALKHPNGAKMSDGDIAEHVGVSQTFVSKVHRESTQHGAKSTVTTGRDGRTINTSNIGAKPAVDE